MRSDRHLYPARRIYQIFALIGLVMTLLFVWTLSQTFDWLTLLFMVSTAFFMMVNARWMLMRAELTPSGLTIHGPFDQTTHIDFRQMAEVHEAGRMAPGVGIVYYGLAENGLIEMDELQTIFLPALEDQQEFLQILRNEVPE